MKPQKLLPLLKTISSVKGVGEKTRPAFEKLVGFRVKDLIYHFPMSVIDRRNMPAITDTQNGQVVTLIVTVDQHLGNAKPNDKSSPYRIRCYNETGFITLVYFNAFPRYLRGILPVGQTKVISGKIDKFNGEIQMMHPDYIENIDKIDNVTSVEPIYGLTNGISQKILTKIIKNALVETPDLPEWIDGNLMKLRGWSAWGDAIKAMHNPDNYDDLDYHNPNRQRLAYDELLANQLALAISRKFSGQKNGLPMQGNGVLRNKLLKKLPFELTSGQIEVIKEINADQESSNKMLRLLQGDVGSGKTIVALMAALNAVEAGKQVAIMAPTEILATQHYSSISDLLEGMNCKVSMLIGKTKTKERRQILADLGSGEIDILIGTHALFQDNVIFKDLGFVVIDEQHRFGVNQREALSRKGENSDVLLMSATPIPRTLTMTFYGDMESSRITTKPVGRKPIETKIVPTSKIKDILMGMKRVLERGEKIYWICPLVEESEKLDLVAVENRYQDLKKIFGDQVGLLHGKMKPEEREQVMFNYRDGHLNILVATTVVEVGVDVKESTAIIIEHAERFGLSQLHQLRGRVGRNDKQSSCVLLYHSLGKISKERLKIMRESNDGFYLAEQDLRLRGGGDVMGTKQSGMPDFKVADLYYNIDLLKIANQKAVEIVLDGKIGEEIKTLLYLFGYDKQVGMVKTACS